jgi:hypothetical protein
MRFLKSSFALVSLGLAANLLSAPAKAQTTLEPLPPPPPVESLDTTGAASPARPQVAFREVPAQTAHQRKAAEQSAFYEVATKPAPVAPRPSGGPSSSLMAVSGAKAIMPVLLSPTPTAAAAIKHAGTQAEPAGTHVVASNRAPQTLVAVATTQTTSLPGVLDAVPSRSAPPASAMPAYERPIPQTGLSVPASALLGAVRLGAATGGPTLREVVPSDVADVVFTSASDVEPAAGWFTRTYRAALKRSGLLASKPETARYELTAEVRSMAITPMFTGVHHRSVVTYRLHDIANGTNVWERTQTANLDVNRGFRFGAMGGALGAALGGALTGQNPAITSQMITNQRGHRPFDVRIDVYEGIMRGFQEMARNSVAELTSPTPGQ